MTSCGVLFCCFCQFVSVGQSIAIGTKGREGTLKASRDITYLLISPIHSSIHPPTRPLPTTNTSPPPQPPTFYTHTHTQTKTHTHLQGYKLGVAATLALWVVWDCVVQVAKFGKPTIVAKMGFPVFRGAFGDKRREGGGC
jgi:hypothetical protein